MMNVKTLIAAALLVFGSAQAAEAPFPNRPIRFVIPGAAGSAPDLRARAIAPRLGQALGQPVVVENRPGALGRVAAQEVARAVPDGHTIVMNGSLLLMSDVLTPDASVPGMRAFAPVTSVAAGPVILAVSATVPVRTLDELIQMARAAPATVSYATAGPGSMQQLIVALFENAAGISMLEVPYKSQALEIPDLISGRITTSAAYYPVLAPHLKSGQVRALAVASQTRLAALPDVPTFVESGFPSVVGKGWMGVMVPLGTPEPVIRRLHKELAEILRSPEVVEQWVASGAEPGGNTPEEFAAYIREEYDRWSRLLREPGVKAN